MLDPTHLQAIFGKPPADAIDFLASKGYKIGWNWQDTLDDAHARAFTVAKVARVDILQDIHQSLITALEKGQTFEEWSKNITPTLQNKGWWGKQFQVDSKGNTRQVQLGSPNRLKTIYQTNMQSAYMAGRYQQMLDTVDTHPYWRYVAILDGRTRPSHRAMNGKIFRYDDSFWATCYPPNGFNCRCRVSPTSSYKVEKNNLTVDDSEGKLETQESVIGQDGSGKDIIAKRTGIQVQGANGKNVFFAPDAGFNVSPSEAQANLGQHLLQSAASAPPKIAAQVIEATLANPKAKAVLVKDYQAWAEPLLDKQAFSTGELRYVGGLPSKSLPILEQHGLMPASDVIAISDEKLLHGLRSGKVGALDKATWLNLVDILQKPKAILLDVISKPSAPSLLYLFDTGQNGKFVVEIGYLAQLTEKDKKTGKRIKKTIPVNLVKTGKAITNAQEYQSLLGFILIDGILQP